LGQQGFEVMVRRSLPADRRKPDLNGFARQAQGNVEVGRRDADHDRQSSRSSLGNHLGNSDALGLVEIRSLAGDGEHQRTGCARCDGSFDKADDGREIDLPVGAKRRVEARRQPDKGAGERMQSSERRIIAVASPLADNSGVLRLS
jgi:hypothetical protein